MKRNKIKVPKPRPIGKQKTVTNQIAMAGGNGKQKKRHG